MTALGTELGPIPPPARTRFRLATAWRVMRELLANPDDTAKAVEFFYAIGVAEFERSFRRLRRDPEGRRLLAERPILVAALSDRSRLEQLPEGSLGKAYLAYLDANGFRAESLAELNERVRERLEREEGFPPADPARSWWRERGQVLHDLHHVLTGYGTDDVGEATLLAFTLAQRPGPAAALLTLGATLKVCQMLGTRWLAYQWRAFRRGRRTPWMGGVRFEELLPLPLETARLLVGVPSVAESHPGGILRSTR